jgi:predicted subunit of tRNA(5-methylaminomethyl-2-thiouridylate) methyltransferase
MSRQAALMFSGGVDSTVAAVKLLEDFDRIHLLTFANGYGHYAFGRTRRRVRELDQRYPGRFVHFEASIKQMFEEICLSSIKEDYGKYGSAFMWCMGCKLCMHARSIIYCHQNGIEMMSDGSASDSDEMVEQMLLSVSMVYWLYEEWGIEYFVPVYHIGRDDKRQMLRDGGYHLGIPVLDRYLGIQPSCIPGELYYLPYILFNKTPGHEEETVARYIASKRGQLDKVIRAALGEEAI